jgi:uncharacterized protein (DUF1501 family)
MLNPMKISRRTTLLGLAAGFAAGPCSLSFADADTEKRFVVIILRGALDGLAAVVPHGDPNLASWRAGLIPSPQGPDALLDMGGFFGMHPALAGLHGLYAAGECLPVHAVAGSYRTRSHFDAQDYLECGADRRLDSGWLNRATSCLTHRKAPAGDALALGVSVPLLLRGPAMVGSYAPETADRPQPELYARIATLNAGDALTGGALAEGLRERDFSAATLGDPHKPPAPGGDTFLRFAAAAGKLLAAPDGPRIAALELGGWDTHADQASRLKTPLRQLDAGLLALKQAIGDRWPDTLILVMTEFGRTVRINGTAGTDHGTATVAFLLGGKVKGGRVAGTWPGLTQSALFENRDLMPTTEFRSLAKGALTAHLGLNPQALNTVFPGTSGTFPMEGLLRA